jgi:ribulose-phosphate 3-epimerase
MKSLIAVSILNFNFLKLKEELEKVRKLNINHLHYDVMDYDFVDNISFGSKILSDITKEEKWFVDCHMMVKIKNCKISSFLLPFLKANANMITFHYEALSDDQIKDFFSFCEKEKIGKGLAINPETSIIKIIPYLKKIDQILIMSVKPGHGGQKFISATLNKIDQIKKKIIDQNLSVKIVIDGGINFETGNQCLEKGADFLVMGTYLLNENNYQKIKKFL